MKGSPLVPLIPRPRRPAPLDGTVVARGRSSLAADAPPVRRRSAGKDLRLFAQR